MSNLLGFLGVSGIKNLPANAADTSSLPGSERSPGKGNVNLLQYSCLGNSIDRGAWLATVHGVSRVRHDLETKQQQVTCYFAPEFIPQSSKFQTVRFFSVFYLYLPRFTYQSSESWCAK